MLDNPSRDNHDRYCKVVNPSATPLAGRLITIDTIRRMVDDLPTVTRHRPDSPSRPIDLVLIHDESGSMWQAAGAWMPARAVGTMARDCRTDDPDRVGYVGFGSADLGDVVPLAPVAGEADCRQQQRRRHGPVDEDRGGIHAVAFFLRKRPPSRSNQR